jgi:hypothetical protein
VPHRAAQIKPAGRTLRLAETAQCDYVPCTVLTRLGETVVTQLLAFLALFAVLCLSVHGAQRLAIRRGRSTTVWMWAVALLGPFPLALLAAMPKRSAAKS